MDVSTRCSFSSTVLLSPFRVFEMASHHNSTMTTQTSLVLVGFAQKGHFPFLVILTISHPTIISAGWEDGIGTVLRSSRLMQFYTMYNRCEDGSEERGSS